MLKQAEKAQICIPAFYENNLFKLSLVWLCKNFGVADLTRMSRDGSRRPAASRSSPSPAAPGGNDPGNVSNSTNQE